MKQLVLIRHAKSDFASAGMGDMEREITSAGGMMAEKKALELKQFAIFPNLLMTSPAKRALETAEIFARTLDYPLDQIKIEPKLYESDVEILLNLIQAIEAQIETAFIVGHNPSMSWLAMFLSNREDINLSPCGIFIIRFEMSTWNKIRETEGSVINL